MYTKYNFYHSWKSIKFLSTFSFRNILLDSDFLLIYIFRTQWFPAHHRDRLVIIFILRVFWFLYLPSALPSQTRLIPHQQVWEKFSFCLRKSYINIIIEVKWWRWNNFTPYQMVVSYVFMTLAPQLPYCPTALWHVSVS